MSRIIESACKCGEPILIEIGGYSARADGVRPHYPDSYKGTTCLRCRKCHDWLENSCKEARCGDE